MKGKIFMRRESLKVVRLFWGLFLYSLGIVLTMRANLGYSPWEVFHQGIGQHLGLTMGIANIIVALAMVLVSVLMKEHVGFGTICNMIFIGAFIDILLAAGWIPLMENFVQGIVMVVAGLGVSAVASFFYMGAGYGAGPRDSLMVVLTKRTKKPVGFCRSCLEGTILVLGWLLGGYVGIGTVISAFALGVVIQIVFTLLRFDVKTIRQESLYETCVRFKKFLQARPAS